MHVHDAQPIQGLQCWGCGPQTSQAAPATFPSFGTAAGGTSAKRSYVTGERAHRVDRLPRSPGSMVTCRCGWCVFEWASLGTELHGGESSRGHLTGILDAQCCAAAAHNDTTGSQPSASPLHRSPQLHHGSTNHT